MTDEMNIKHYFFTDENYEKVLILLLGKQRAKEALRSDGVLITTVDNEKRLRSILNNIFHGIRIENKATLAEALRLEDSDA